MAYARCLPPVFVLTLFKPYFVTVGMHVRMYSIRVFDPSLEDTGQSFERAAAMLQVVTLLVGFVVGILFLIWLFTRWIRFIPNNRVGIVEKRFGGRGSLRSGFIALNGEAGFQPRVLRGGMHLLTPFQYGVHIMPLVTIPQGKIGYIFARDGVALDAAQTLAANDKVHAFEDAEAFLRNGGQRGPQRLVLREGTYAFNLALFVVITEETVYSLPLSREEEIIVKRMATTIGERDGFAPVVIKDSD
ncbi:MAG TPA: hypothetical protein VFT99_24435, partial [Roseiflexaceae bacterium]|nr:hypothetical protein [Roseiflexaceae bacterium]